MFLSHPFFQQNLMGPVNEEQNACANNFIQSQMIHVCFTYIYHKNHLNVGENIPYMDPMGISINLG